MTNLFKHEKIYRGELKYDLPILVCGCGTIGSNLIDNLYRQGFTNITVLDNDRVEPHNINTQIWSMQDVGLQKVQAMQNRVFGTVKEELKIISKKLEEKNASKLLKGYNLIVDAFDNVEARTILKNVKDIPVIHGGLYEDYAECVWNDKYVVPEPDGSVDVCDYPLARNVSVLLTAVMSEEIVRFCLNQKPRNFSITLGDLKINAW